MELILRSESHVHELVNIETLKNMLIIFTICVMWYLHNRQIQALKAYTDSNISIILNKINNNQDEIFIILKDIDLIINIKNKPEDEGDEEDDDPSSDYEP